ncbi:MAG: ATP-binding cassette domain-containing protein [Phycisphaerae bacterium]|nr:sugar ABC transporter ATP-binding protein [Phycisphaerae bacterium]NIR67970.1 sugar ABC transporter ATP-binding protein [candidate division Zixibacteria bacterium]NIP55099.1 sugar ABC transporter ATP-binding protein [Phycisphaerae bacterium]NIS53804.1 sugar ABC transporter ATP-binding protein [Phycisphaerae bacterium]NIU11402.1 sugar ABC transporter ATP-binding protein [Phycisphaerae bacterium]
MSEQMTGEYILEMVGISKEFPGVKALENVDYDLKRGEVHAIVGENGAGKSTLIKILAGVYRADSGQIRLKGENVGFQGTKAMIDRGVSVIYQELNLIPYLSVAENIFLGREPLKNKFTRLINWDEMHLRVSEIMQLFDIDINPEARISTLGIAYQQVVEIAKALSLQSEIVVMDEPTATLTGNEVDKLFKVIRNLKKQGVSVIYISHKLEEIRQIADRVTILRDGEKVLTDDVKNITTNKIVKLMVGRDIGKKYPKVDVPIGDELLKVEQLCSKGVCKEVSFNLRRGEILGIAGLVGAGRTEMVQLLFGYRKKDSGRITVNGKYIRVRRPVDAVRAGIGLIPEERRNHGLVLGLSVFDNVTLSILDCFSFLGFINRRKLGELVNSVVDKTKIKMHTYRQIVKNLSGGNQQKIVLAKWFLRNCDVYIFDEPTRGIDVAGKIEIYRLMQDLARNGAGIIMISSELPEVLNISDRILVMYEGKIVREYKGGVVNQEHVLSYAIGAVRDSTTYTEQTLREEK